MESTLVKLNQDIEHIFEDIRNAGYIDIESKYYNQAKERCVRTCSHFYSMHEFLNETDKSDEFLLYVSYLGAWTYFLDDALDYTGVLSHRIRANLISSYLLLRFNNWVLFNYESQYSLFQSYLKRYSQYLIAEKKWEFVQDYNLRYGKLDSLINKAIICLYPIELMRNERIDSIKSLYHYYFTFLLIADDLTDFASDLESKCLTYPIAKFYDINGRLPISKNDLDSVKEHLFLKLNFLKEKIIKLKEEENWRIILIEQEISNIFTFLNSNCC
jgi:hypothetical protein